VHPFVGKFGNVADSRRITDRRKQQFARVHERRLRPDRRLNNISVESIPFDEVCFPGGTQTISFHGPGKNRKSAPSRQMDARENGPTVKSLRQKAWWALNHTGINIFKRSHRGHDEQRRISDRRMQDIKQPYNRRIRPDRRLNNIVVEWIDCPVDDPNQPGRLR
jgi:hypothetical protein